MKKIILVLIIYFLSSGSVFAQESSKIPGWILVWSDEFEGAKEDVLILQGLLKQKVSLLKSMVDLR